MPKIAPTEADHATSTAKGSPDSTTRVATGMAEREAEAAREGMRVAQRAATAFGQMQGVTTRRSAAAELGRLFVQLLNLQTRHNLYMATAIGRAVDWHEVIQTQGEFVRGSFERGIQLNRRYLEAIQTMTRATAFTAGNQRAA